jgi:alcohol dehydrogenase (cytochrome c)
MTARVLALVVLAASLRAQVTFDRILPPEKEPQNWLVFGRVPISASARSRRSHGQRQEPRLQWIWQAKSLEKYEATSIVVDGVLYTVQAPNDVVALDAVTGRPYWTFTYENPPDARNCCGRVNRCVAVLGDMVYMGTLDAHLVALDAKTEAPVEDAGGENGDRYAITPTIVKDKVIVGTAVATSVAASSRPSMQTGREVWRIHTIRSASPATTPGRAIRGRPAAPACGTAPYPRPTWCSSAPATRRRLGPPRAPRRQPL